MRNRALVFIIFFVLVLAFYAKTAGAGFCFDFVSFIKIYRRDGLSSLMPFLKGSGFLPIYHLVFYGMYKLFGLNSWAWMLVEAALHAFTATLLFVLVDLLLVGKGRSGQVAAFVAALFFLLSPHQAEVVVWGAAIHYLVEAICMLSALVLAIKYVRSGNHWLVLTIFLLSFIALYTLEVAVAIPVMCVLLVLFAPADQVMDSIRIKRAIIMAVPQLLGIVAYFISSKVLMGSYFTHYRGKPMQGLDLAAMKGNLLKYMAKFGTFFNFMPYPFREKVQHFMEVGIGGWLIIAVIVVVALVLMVRYKSLSTNLRALWLLFALFVLAAGPLLVLFYHPMFGIENDRHGYFASMFFYPFMAVLIYTVVARLRYVLWGAFLLVSCYLLVGVINNWVGAGKVRDSLVNDYRWYDSPKVYVLNFPTCYNGIWVFESYGDAFGENLLVFKGKDVSASIREVTQLNMVTPNDSATVSIESDSVLSISSWVPGTWLWRKARGLTSYHTDEYTVEAGNLTCNFTIKNKDPQAVYIYAAGSKWREVKW